MRFLERISGYYEEDIVAVLAGVWLCVVLVALLLLWQVVQTIVKGIRGLVLRAKERKKSRAERARRLKFTLPDRENSYVRARLNTALQAEDKAVEGFEPAYLRLGYVRKMLAKVQEATLSPIERLDVEEMSGLLALYTAKEKWSAEDRKAVNEVFSRLLKLSAKYEIAV